MLYTIIYSYTILYKSNMFFATYKYAGRFDCV